MIDVTVPRAGDPGGGNCPAWPWWPCMLEVPGAGRPYPVNGDTIIAV